MGGKFGSINAPTAGARTTEALSVGKHQIQLYSTATPNGVKAAIMLEEVCASYPDFDYDAWDLPINGKQFSSGFVEINPNSKIPAMVDRTTTPPTRVFESGAILVYLAEKFPKTGLLPKDAPRCAEVLSWVFWAIGSPPFLGGGFGHFYAYAPVKLAYPIDRYAMETKRQLDVLDQTLAKRTYIAGESYSLADVAIWPWYGALVLGRLYNAAEFLDVGSYTHVQRWARQLEAERLTIRKGRMVNRGSADSSAVYNGLNALKERHGRSDWNQ